MKVLSVRQPWAHAILHLGKDIENRQWSTEHRGPLVVHASRTPDRSGGFRELGLRRSDLAFGAIVGVVNLRDCVSDSTSPWAAPGLWHWVLDDPQAIDPLPCTGRLRLFDAPEFVSKYVQRSLTR